LIGIHENLSPEDNDLSLSLSIGKLADLVQRPGDEA
jgi:hypothetical protein